MSRPHGELEWLVDRLGARVSWGCSPAPCRPLPAHQRDACVLRGHAACASHICPLQGHRIRREPGPRAGGERLRPCKHNIGQRVSREGRVDECPPMEDARACRERGDRHPEEHRLHIPRTVPTTPWPQRCMFSSLRGQPAHDGRFRTSPNEDTDDSARAQDRPQPSHTRPSQPI